MGKSPDGAVRLWELADITRQNAYGRPLTGWKPTSAGEGLYNPAGFAMLWVVLQQWIPEREVLGDLYDQPMLVENLGAIVVPLLHGKVGLVENFHRVGARIMQAEANYVERLNSEKRWGELLSNLGMWQWGVPRGIPPTKIRGKFNSDQELALATAHLEALQEAGFVLRDKEIVGRINPDPTFFTHPQYVIKGNVVRQTTAKPEDVEMLGEVRFFSPHEVRGLVENFYLEDGLTKAALADAGFHY